MNWEDFKSEFDFDGSWMDIYILETDASDWQQVMGFLCSYASSCTMNSNGMEMPSDAENPFKDKSRPFLKFNLDSIVFDCHFFVEDTIEFDFDPRQIRDESDANKVFDLMNRLSRLLNKEVLLTLENAPESPIFKASPNRAEISYISPTS